MKTQNTTNSLNKKAAFLFASFIFMSALNAQDKITLNNGEEIKAKVMEVTDNEIKFKKEDNPEGPTRVISKNGVFSITYLNGSKDVFGLAAKPEKKEITDEVYVNPKEHVMNANVTKRDTDEFLPEKHKKFGGPRIGMTYISSGTSADYITDKGKNPLITQFGWQFEERIFTIDNGTSGVVEFVPLIGGMEQGMFLPSANLLIGLRSGGKRSFEFALGPNVSLSGLGMVFAAGTNFHSGKINFPVNIAFVPSVGSQKTVYDQNTGAASKQHFDTGWRLSLTVGFNSRKK